MRKELESSEYEPTRTGVRYAAPEGMHDDCVVALALANEQARGRCKVALAFLSPVRRADSVAESPLAYFRRTCEDPEWGFAPSRWN